jgi:hypothetical protein
MKEFYFLIESGHPETLKETYVKENGAVCLGFVKELVVDTYLVFSFHDYCSSSDGFEIKKWERMRDVAFVRDRRIKKQADRKSQFRCVKAKLRPGVYFPRVYRPVLSKLGRIRPLMFTDRDHKTVKKAIGYFEIYQPVVESTFVSGVNQLVLLKDDLNSIFQSIHPIPRNHAVYGHRIRNLLILACTEVEAQLKGILTENIKTPRKQYNTKDYVKLRDLLKLTEYQISFAHYPEIGTVSPFQNWDEDSPTQSITWYDSYNAVKHDRETQFDKATLFNAIQAIAALAILTLAQYGETSSYWKDRMGGFFRIEKRPKWKIIEHYLPPYAGSNWKSGRGFL